jgi:O-methyltransferase/methyltransferase family protein
MVVSERAQAPAKPQPRPSVALNQMLLGNRVQQAIYVAAKLGVADELVDGPRPIDDLARAVGANADALGRLLRALVGVGIFSDEGDGVFGLTPIADLLRSGTRESKRAFALWSGGLSYELFGALEYSVRTGEPAFDELFGMPFFDYLNEHADVGQLFDEFMARQTAPLSPLLAEYDLTGVGTVVDVGGGHGNLIAGMLATHPELRGILVDVPRVIEAASALEGRLGDRFSAVVGDILESVPSGGDLYLLKHIVHGLDDETAARVLTNCRKAMNDDGRVLLVEFVMPEGNDPHPARLMDLLMLVGGPGRERTEAEFHGLLANAGLTATRFETTKYLFSLIEARPA